MNKEIENIISAALKEDLGSGDITTDSIVPSDKNFYGEFIAKSEGIIAGWDIVKQTFNNFEDKVEINVLARDGQTTEKGQLIATIKGSARTILSGERVALNFLQRMSGIATLTRKFVDSVIGTQAVILDTRKTVPNLRVLDKMAVKIGGGDNHRFGLYDMVMLKDNHIVVAGSITEAVRLVREKNKDIPIEVEVKNLVELEEALKLDLYRIMLDNMSVNDMAEAVQITNKRVPLEASGNVSLETVRNIASTGVNYISVGQLTHSVKAMDISLNIIE